MLRIGLRSTFARQPCNWIRSCGFISGSFLFIINSAWPFVSSCMIVWLLYSFGYPNLHISCPFSFEGNTMHYILCAFVAYLLILCNLGFHSLFRCYFFGMGDFRVLLHLISN